MQHVAEAGLVPTSASALPPLRLRRPVNIDAVLHGLRDAERPLLLAGGTDLVAAFNEGLTATDLIDLSRIEALRRVEADDEGLSLGAMVTHHVGSRDARVIARAGGFAEAWSRIANPRIRFTATLGGNLMARRVRYEGSLLLSALGARLRFVSEAGDAELSPEQVLQGAAPERSLLLTMHVPTADLQWFGYERSLRPLLTLATALRRHQGQLVLGCSVATEYLRPVMLHGKPGKLAALAEASSARALADEVFAQLPASFADPVLDVTYARAAGAALLARQLQEAARA